MLSELDGKVCPGEEFCTTDEAHGEIAGVFGRSQGRTLENYCHCEESTKFNGKKQGCPLYPTKPENTPKSLLGAIDTAEVLRRYKQRGTLPTIYELTAWEYCCFDTAEEASEVVQNEKLKEASNDSKNTDTDFGKIGQGEEDGGAFSKW